MQRAAFVSFFRQLTTFGHRFPHSLPLTCRPLRSQRPSWASRRCWTPAMWLARSPTTWASSPTSPGTTASSTGSLTVGTVKVPRCARIRSQVFSKHERCGESFFFFFVICDCFHLIFFSTKNEKLYSTMQQPLQGEPRPHIQSVHICEMSVQSVSNYPKSRQKQSFLLGNFHFSALRA